MTLFEISAILITAAAVGSFINDKWLKIPSSIALLLFAMAVGFIGILLKKMGISTTDYVEKFLSGINFEETVFHGMLAFILFAGALQIDIDELKSAKWPIAITTIASTFISTIILGLLFYFLLNQLGFSNVSLLYAMLFGAILSPTDPIAVLAIVKKMNASKHLETTIIGESLFNDCVALVFFLVLIELINAKGGGNTIASTIQFLLSEIGGGVLFGLIIGWLAYYMLLHTNNYYIELLITLAVTTGGYALAEDLHFSAPLSMVIAGIVIGNHGRFIVMDGHTHKYVGIFWEMIDEVLNAVLFLLLGLEMMVINASLPVIILATICIFIALFARFVSIAIPLTIMKPFYKAQKGTIAILTWGGLRGALSIAMVLSLQDHMIKQLFLPCVYFVVIFSIAIQGLTFNRLLKRYKFTATAPPSSID
jgi:Na+:H+ antiporter